MIRILKNISGGIMHMAICWSGSSNLHLYMEEKFQLCKSYCYQIYKCTLWRHSYQNSIRKLAVSYSDSFKRLINVPRYTSSSLVFAMNATHHINVAFRIFAYSLMSRVIAPPTVVFLPLSIAMHICSFSNE